MATAPGGVVAMDLEITWTIEFRTTPDGDWNTYDDGDRMQDGPTESFIEAVSPPESGDYNRDIVEWRLVKTTREVVRTKRRDSEEGSEGGSSTQTGRGSTG